MVVKDSVAPLRLRDARLRKAYTYRMNIKTLTTRAGRQISVRQLIDEDISVIESRFERDEFAIDDMFLETQLTHPEYGQRMLVALVDDHIVGKLRISFNQFDVAAPYAENIGFIKDLQVTPEFREEGIGSILIACAEEVIQEEGKSFAGLRIVWDNPRPLKMCIRSGFRNMYMEFPDAFDLYKELHAPFETLTDDEVRRLAQEMILKAQALCETQNMSASFSWR